MSSRRAISSLPGDLFLKDGDAGSRVGVGFVGEGVHAGRQGVQPGGVQAGRVAGETVQVGDEPDGGFGELVDEAPVGAGTGLPVQSSRRLCPSILNWFRKRPGSGNRCSSG